MYDLNDYELLYQIKEKDEFAYYLMTEKYSRFILSKIRKFGFSNERDEYYQEGIIVLGKAIETFRDEYNKTFTRYFEKLLINKFINLRKKKKEEYEFYEDVYMCENYVLEEIEKSYEVKKIKNFLDDIEKKIFVDYFVDNFSIDYISKKYEIETNKVYVKIRTIRKKIKKNML